MGYELLIVVLDHVYFNGLPPCSQANSDDQQELKATGTQTDKDPLKWLVKHFILVSWDVMKPAKLMHYKKAC